MMIVAAVVSAAKPWTGSSFTTRWPIVFMIRQPPAAVPSDIAVAAIRMTHVGTVLLEMAGGEKGQGHDAHRLLGVVRAVAQGHVGRGDDLESAETIVHQVRVGMDEDVQQDDHQAEADDQAKDGRADQRDHDLRDEVAPLDGSGAGRSVAAPIRPPTRAWLLELGMAGPT